MPAIDRQNLPAGLQLQMKNNVLDQIRKPDGLGTQETFPFNGDFVILFARLRLDSINKWLDTCVQRLTVSKNQTDALNGIIDKLAQYAQGTDGKDAQFDDIKKSINDAIPRLQDGCPLQERLKSLVNDPDSLLNRGATAGISDKNLTAEEITALSGELKNDLKSIDQNDQETQLWVNKMSGEQQQVLQLAASLIAALSEGSKTIAQKIA